MNPAKKAIQEVRRGKRPEEALKTEAPSGDGGDRLRGLCEEIDGLLASLDVRKLDAKFKALQKEFKRATGKDLDEFNDTDTEDITLMLSHMTYYISKKVVESTIMNAYNIATR